LAVCGFAPFIIVVVVVVVAVVLCFALFSFCYHNKPDPQRQTIILFVDSETCLVVQTVSLVFHLT
jgi:hypothetical protein